jgi:hypothetical protein
MGFLEIFHTRIFTDKGKEISLFGLLLACVMFIFILPLIPSGLNWLSKILLSVIIILAASSISGKVLVFGFIVIAIEWLTKLFDFLSLHFLSEVTTNLFIVLVAATFVMRIMKRQHVTFYTLLEALNGYLLLGIMFASFVYFIAVYKPDSFSGGILSELDLTYYSFITISTTGYGDIVPLTPAARSLSLLIAITGQFYVAVVVAILVGKYANTIKTGD